MKHREGRVLEALHSVQLFLDSHGEALASINDSGARKTARPAPGVSASTRVLSEFSQFIEKL